jgi:hypothetical protein
VLEKQKRNKALQGHTPKDLTSSPWAYVSQTFVPVTKVTEQFKRGELMISEVLVHHGGEGMAEHSSSPSGGQKAEEKNACAYGFLLLPLLFRPQPMGWCPHSRWVFPSSLILFGNTLTDTARVMLY